MIQASGNGKERKHASGTVGIDSLGSGKWLSLQWEKGTEVELSKMIQALCSHDCEENGVTYPVYLVQASGIVVNLSLENNITFPLLNFE